MSFWKEWLDLFDVKKFISDPQRVKIKPELKSLLKRIEDAEEHGYELLTLKTVGYIISHLSYVQPIYEATKFAYKCGDGNDAYACVKAFLVVNSNITDTNDRNIYYALSERERIPFILEYISGNSARLPVIHIKPPRL